MSDSNILIVNAGEVNWSESQPKRAGIILYDSKGFYMGLDNYHKELTDFGGEINYINEDTLSGALREYKEETLGTFPELNWYRLFTSRAIISDSIVIFLIKTDQDLSDNVELFRKKRQGQKRIELDDILYIHKENVLNYPIFHRIRSMMSYVMDHFDWN